MQALLDSINSIAKGEFSTHISENMPGLMGEVNQATNRLASQLQHFSNEVIEVAHQVGSEGILGGQAKVPEAQGAWLDLTNQVNNMADNLTTQVRDISNVVTAVAKGDLSRSIQVQAKGEVAQLAKAINGMVDTLSIFAQQAAVISREVGIMGVLGGQAQVPGATGIWRDLTDNMNLLTHNLTAQVRAMSKAVNAVSAGDLSRFIQVDSLGELAELRDNINTMIRALQQTTEDKLANDWLQQGVSQINDVMRSEISVSDLANRLISKLCNYLGATVGTLYLLDESNQQHAELRYRLVGGYAIADPGRLGSSVMAGEGLLGQAIFDKRVIKVEPIPQDYIYVSSALGKATPTYLLIAPFLFEGKVKGAIELGAFENFSEVAIQYLEQSLDNIATAFDSSQSRVRLKDALRQSEALTDELQIQQEVLQQTNEQMAAQTEALELAQKETQERNLQLEQAQADINQRAEQLALASKYKSEFLASMSHELRTPLNSIMLLSKLLESGDSGPLTQEQQTHVQVIRKAGQDLLQLINEVLDLSSIEAGKMGIRISEVSIENLLGQLDATFRMQMQSKGIALELYIDSSLPLFIRSDADRIQQVLRNFLSNALKFTQTGKVSVQVTQVSPRHTNHLVMPNVSCRDILANPADYVALDIQDTGAGISQDQFALIFQAFKQADGAIQREFGGTGLGLSISLQITEKLEGAIALKSKVGKGSCFSLILPKMPKSQLLVSSAPKVIDQACKEQVRGETDTATRPARKHHTPEKPVFTSKPRLFNGEMVLIVDDDVRNTYSVTAVLRKYGLNVTSVCDGQACLDYLNGHEHVDILLMDLMMPVMDGYEAIRRIRSQTQWSNLPIVAVTANALKQEAGKCLDAGASDYISKPIDYDELVSMLHLWLSSPHQQVDRLSEDVLETH